ncbi:DNA modification system-associated small protein [Anoxybacillus sp. KU2-6(11)]|uniref:DNA modification system-associated small protein n=1 Tax=Anoxybacillus sp. KU2-6(11) TaxID=1535751 RepID=UPI00350F50D2
MKKKKIIEEICEKYKLKPSYFTELFNIEKEYADRNMETRRGIYKEIKSKIDNWIR